jgi:hypothetical protein
METFTDYAAFLKTLGPSAQVITFDDVPTPNGYAYFDPYRYAAQGLVFGFANPTALRYPSAVSSPNVYYSSVYPRGGKFEDETALGFTRDGRPALTSAFGTFFLGSEGSGGALWVYGADGQLSRVAGGLTSRPAFLGVATVDSLSGPLVPSIREIAISAGGAGSDAFLDNFTFAAPVSAVPEANGWVLLAAAALAAVGLGRRCVAASVATALEAYDCFTRAVSDSGSTSPCRAPDRVPAGVSGPGRVFLMPGVLLGASGGLLGVADGVFLKVGGLGFRLLGSSVLAAWRQRLTTRSGSAGSFVARIR